MTNASYCAVCPRCVGYINNEPNQWGCFIEDHYKESIYLIWKLKQFAKANKSSYEQMKSLWCIHEHGQLMKFNCCKGRGSMGHWKYEDGKTITPSKMRFMCQGCKIEWYDADFVHPMRDYYDPNNGKVDPQSCNFCYNCLEQKFPEITGVRIPPDPKWFPQQLTGKEANSLLADLLGDEFGDLFRS